MVTVSPLGAAAFLCVLIGIPAGGLVRQEPARLQRGPLPVLDFMQTMPAFVYLIPIIAFFGTGKPPGVLATLVFGTGPGDAGGLAILFCAMVIDRIVQGHYKRSTARHRPGGSAPGGYPESRPRPG